MSEPLEVNPLKLIGVNPLSPFADLFVNIYNVTKPSSEWMKNYNPRIFKNENISYNPCIFDDRDTNKNVSDSSLRTLSPGKSYDDEDLEQEDYKIREEKNKRQEYFSDGPVQCCNRWLKDSAALAMHQKSHSNQSRSGQLDNRLDIDEQLDMDQSPVRIEWLRGLMDFMADRGSPFKHCPTLPGSEFKRPLDLYKFYNLVQLYGSGRGSDNCDIKAWQDISELMGVSLDDAHVLQRLYRRYLLFYELHLVSGTSNFEDGDTSQGQEDYNFNLPSPVRIIVDGDGNWKRKNKKIKQRLGKRERERKSVFKRLGKKTL